MLYNDDCLNVLKGMLENTIDMVYLDPPFFTQKQQILRSSTGKTFEFSDVWNSRKEYVTYLQKRLIEIHRVIKPTGTVFLHCDSASSHYLRILLDDIFGVKNFQSEIIWTYKRWSNSRKGFLPAHQTIFFYSKTNKYTFNTEYTEYSPTTNIDQILQERIRNSEGKAVYKRSADGSTILSKEKKGVPLSDVWDIPFLNPKAKERTGYPTQKPIELLDRIIRISTNKGDCVLDPFCGSGTTLVSAKLLERRYIGIDINQEAIALCESRLNNPFKTESKLLRIGADSYKMKTPEEMAILSQFDCDIVQRNKGIDAFLRKRYLGAPVAIRLQRNNEMLQDAIEALDFAARRKGCSFALLVTNNSQSKDIVYTIPNNMIILDKMNVQLENEIQNKLLSMKASI